MKIPAWLALAFKILLGIVGIFITAVSSSPQYFGGSSAANAIVFWLGLSSTVLSFMFSTLGTGNVTSQTIVGKVE